MIKPQVTGNKIVFGPCRMSYVYLFQKVGYKGVPDPVNGKYRADILIPKEEKETLAAIKKAIDAARDMAVEEYWGGVQPQQIRHPIKDGDEIDPQTGERKREEAYRGCYFLSAQAGLPVGIIDRHKQPITDETQIYSGVWCCVSVSFYGYHVRDYGITCGLNNIMKVKDDNPLGGRASAVTDFSDVFIDDADLDTSDDFSSDFNF